jgi:hypothetical protein
MERALLESSGLHVAAIEHSQENRTEETIDDAVGSSKDVKLNH